MSKLNLGDSLILDSDIVVNGAEVKTGATYNGKPVYCKAFTIPNFTAEANTYTAKNFSIAGATKVLFCKSRFFEKIGSNTGYYYNDKHIYGGPGSPGFFQFVGLTAIGNNWGSFDAMVTNYSVAVSDIEIFAWYIKD